MNKERLPRLTEPKRRKNRGGKIIFLLTLFFLALLAVLFFRSDLSKIDTIEIVGVRYTKAEQVGQALGVQEGNSFFAATGDKLQQRVAELPYVKTTEVKKTFPGKIHVHIEEFEEVAYSLDASGQIQAMLENGMEVEPLPGEPIRYLPILSDWESGSKPLIAMTALLSQIPGPVLADISQIKFDPSSSYPDRIRMYTRSYFEVITTIEYLPHKLDYMRAIIAESEPGVITMLEANTHQPYTASDDASLELEAGEQAGSGVNKEVS